jgi:hypothetical protein
MGMAVPPARERPFTLQTIGGRLRQQGKQVFYIVPKKGHEFRPLWRRNRRSVRPPVSSSPELHQLIMEIRRTRLDTHSELSQPDGRDVSVLADKIARSLFSTRS